MANSHDFDPHNFAMLRDAAREHVAEDARAEAREHAYEDRIMDGRERMEALLSKRGKMPSRAAEVDAVTNAGFCQAALVWQLDAQCKGHEDVAITLDHNVWVLCVEHARKAFKITDINLR